MEFQHIVKEKWKAFRRERSTIVDITPDNVWCAHQVENAYFGKTEVTCDLVEIGFGPCEASYLVIHKLEVKMNSIWKNNL